ncbi:hypothetical protein [Microvirga sp. Mcv34]|uniref:hypothetical protein n=1 Tax=Microvirga sp. Mcv34 TaxID=2926016 RepID=UPI0021C91DC6|nr:hypothetical protein [Microvirga sp. Mcv34]
MSDPNEGADGAIAVGQRVRYVGHPEMTTWNKPCIGVTGRLTLEHVFQSKYTETEQTLWVFEPELPGKCLSPWMYVRFRDIRPIAEDVPSQGEASLSGDCSYEAMLRKASVTNADCSRP